MLIYEERIYKDYVKDILNKKCTTKIKYYCTQYNAVNMPFRKRVGRQIFLLIYKDIYK